MLDTITEFRVVLSPSRTSSQALVSAMSERGAEAVGHTHFLGWRTLAEKRAEFGSSPLPPMLRAAIELRARVLGDPAGLRIVSCIRDPIARQLSHLFKFPDIPLSLAGIDVHSRPEEASRWIVETFHRRRPLTWFDEHISEPVGVDLFRTPFDPVAKILRLEHRGARLAVIRFEDSVAVRENALGWLLDRAAMPVDVVDRTAEQPTGSAYSRFCDDFVAPESLLRQVYDAPMMMHFYSNEERAAFHERWSRRQA
jgi:hypothetical protein